MSRRNRRGVPPDIRKRLEQQQGEAQQDELPGVEAAPAAPLPGQWVLPAAVELLGKVAAAQQMVDYLIEQCDASAGVVPELRDQLEECRGAVEDAFQAASYAAGAAKVQRMAERGEE